MKERYVIGIELLGVLTVGGALIYSLGLISAAAVVVGVSLVVTAQIVRTR
jgi:hypothetical protein